MNSIILSSDGGPLAEALQRAYSRIAQQHLDYNQRSLTAKNYDSSIQALMIWMQRIGIRTPDKSALERWRDDMLLEGSAVSTVNARLSAVRKLLRTVAEDSTDVQVKMVLKDWAAVENADKTFVMDLTEADFGRRMEIDEVQALYQAFPEDLKGLRDRALFAVMVGAGLRVNEAVCLTLEDLKARNALGQIGIRVQHGKRNKSRVSVLNPGSWVYDAVSAYTELKGGTTAVFSPIKKTHSVFVSLPKQISKGAAQDAMKAIGVECHDLRRTYAYLSKKAGMSWEDLRDNLGHSSVTITERYVGHSSDWATRVPSWGL